MSNNWMVLLPPLIVLISAFISRNIIISLISGVFTAALIASDLVFTKSVFLTISVCKDQLFDIDNLFLFGFLFIIGVIVSLIGATGGAHAFGERLIQKISSARSVQKTALL